jgi:hypothetical protein
MDSCNSNNTNNDAAQLTAALSSVHISSAEPGHSSSSTKGSSSTNNSSCITRAVCDPDLYCNFDLDAALDGEYQA